MKKDILKEIIIDFHQTPLPRSHRRHLSVPLETGKIITIMGVRRSGKTYYLFQLMKDLLNRSCDKKHLLYINFEDERLDFKREELDLILQSYREL
jgi:predicted AAA+ superfamily ATPase